MACGKVFRRNCDLRRHSLTHNLAGINSITDVAAAARSHKIDDNNVAADEGGGGDSKGGGGVEGDLDRVSPLPSIREVAATTTTISVPGSTHFNLISVIE